MSDNRLYDKETKEFLYLGSGWSNPFNYNAVGGVSRSYNMFENFKLIREQIRYVMGVRAGERRMLRDFGCNLRKFVFEPLDEKLAVRAREEVYEGLSRWIPEITLDGTYSDGYILGVYTNIHPVRNKILEIKTNYAVERYPIADSLVIWLDWDTKKIIEQLNQY